MKMDWYDLFSRGLQWIDYAENVYNKPSATKGTMYQKIIISFWGGIIL